MNRKLFWYLLLRTSHLLYAAPGCMDNSWHMSHPFDTKSYHIVAHPIGTNQTFCQCPCRSISADRGICFECGHAGPFNRGSSYTRTGYEWVKQFKLISYNEAKKGSLNRGSKKVNQFPAQ